MRNSSRHKAAGGRGHENSLREQDPAPPAYRGSSDRRLAKRAAGTAKGFDRAGAEAADPCHPALDGAKGRRAGAGGPPVQNDAVAGPAADPAVLPCKLAADYAGEWAYVAFRLPPQNGCVLCLRNAVVFEKRAVHSPGSSVL